MYCVVTSVCSLIRAPPSEITKRYPLPFYPVKMETATPVQETESSHSPSLAPICTDSALTANPFFDYRKLIDDISTRLFKENALRLANLYELPSWYFEIGLSKDPSYALRVLMALEGKGLYSPSNLKGLVEALKSEEH